jgi:hypothetical protein
MHPQIVLHAVVVLAPLLFLGGIRFNMLTHLLARSDVIAMK